MFTHHVIERNTGSGRKQQCFNISQKPEDVGHGGDCRGGRLAVEDDAVEQ